MSAEEETSRRISSLRFLLIVFVVFIHNTGWRMEYASGVQVFEVPRWADLVRIFLSDIVARCAVPLFFLFSGYLLFRKEEPFARIVRKKTRSLLVPYLLWNGMAVAFYAAAQALPLARDYFTNPANDFRSFGLLQWVDAFAGLFTSRAPFPIVYPLWFIRDLFILSLLSPVFRKLAGAAPVLLLGALGLLWAFDLDIMILSTEALLFFTLGLYAARWKPGLAAMDAIRLADLGLLWAAVIALELFPFAGMPPVHKLNVILGALFFLRLSWWLVRSDGLYRLLARLEGYAFFVYAFHEPLMTICKKVGARVIPMRGGWVLLHYFLVTAIVIAVSLACGVLLKRLLPAPYALLTGGRAGKNREAKP